jgi:lysyl-tRNA synthetase class 2
MQPSLVELIRFRAAVESAVRAWFEARDVLPVVAPTLVHSPGMEPHLRAFAVRPEEAHELGERYLHTSPEYAIKSVFGTLDADVYAMVRCYRDEPPSRWHHAEFTMVEWYRRDADYTALMDDCASLVAACAAAVGLNGPVVWPGTGLTFDTTAPWRRIALADAFASELGLDLHESDAAVWRAAARRAGVDVGDDWDIASVFSALYGLVLEPSFCAPGPAIVYGFPVSEAALSRKSAADPRIAERFEAYLPLPPGLDLRGNLEIANAFSELIDASEQRDRLLAEQAWRATNGRVVYPMPEAMLDGLTRMRPTAGIALGFERLLVWLALASRGWQLGVADFLVAEPLRAHWLSA